MTEPSRQLDRAFLEQLCGVVGPHGLLSDPADLLTYESDALMHLHAARLPARVADDGSRMVLAEHFQGKRLNSPNDVVVAKDGSLYFTDPPFGLPNSFDDPARELPFAGVFHRAPDGTLTLLIDDLEAPFPAIDALGHAGQTP